MIRGYNKLLDGKDIDDPHLTNVTFRPAPRVRREEAIPLELPLGEGEFVLGCTSQ
jgi:hypothetical protein